MNLKCNLGFHTWDGCKCTQCGKTRDEQHDWLNDCEKCSRCGKTRENQHGWSKDGEKCSRCEKKYQEIILESFRKKGADIESLLSKITDQNILCEVICSVSDQSVQKKAIEKLTDEQIITDLVENTSVISVSNTGGNMIGYLIMKSGKLPVLQEINKLTDGVFRDRESMFTMGNTDQLDRIIKLIEIGKPLYKYIANSMIGMIPGSGQNRSMEIYKNIGLLCLALAKMGGTEAVKILNEFTKFNFYKVYEYKYIMGALALGLAYIGLTNDEALVALKNLKREYEFGSLKNVNNYLLMEDLGSNILGTNIEELNY